VAKQPVADRDLCIGSGHCVEVCPNVFELVEEKSEVIGVGKCNICNCLRRRSTPARCRQSPGANKTYMDQPNKMAGIYAELHQNLQEKFNEGCVEIMPSHYSSLWNDDKTANLTSILI